LVYDVTSKTSFEHIEDWLREVTQHASANTMRALVGNKADLVEQKVVSTSEAEAFAKKLSVPFWETSAKNSSNVETMFISMAKDLIAQKKKSPEVPANPTPDVVIQPEKAGKGGGCC
jgi:GTPase SAR1 family protein